MAENTEKEERKTKVGEKNYLTSGLLDLARKNKDSFLQYARTQGKLNNEQILLLSSIIDNIGERMETTGDISFTGIGQLQDASGELQNGQNMADVVINPAKKFLGIKYKNEQTEKADLNGLATYFYNQIINSSSPYEEKKKDTGWNLTKHGLSAYLIGNGRNAKRIFEEMDKPGEDDEIRSTAERRADLKNALSGYNTWLNGQGFDFTQNDNPFDDDFSSALQNAVNNYDDLSDNDLYTALTKLGAGDFADAYLSTKFSMGETEEDRQAKKDAKKAKEEEALRKRNEEWRKEAMKQMYGDWDTAKGGKTMTTKFVTDFGNDSNGNPIDSLERWILTRNDADKAGWGTWLGASAEDASKWTAAGNSVLKYLRGEGQYTDKNMGLVILRILGTPGQTLDLNDGSRLLINSVNNNGVGYAFTPQGYGYQVHLFDLYKNGQLDSNVQGALNKLIEMTIQKNHPEYEMQDTTPYFEEGGVVKAQMGQLLVFQPWEVDDVSEVKERAKKNNRTEKQQKAGERFINSSNKTEENPDAGFSSIEMLRLASIGANIASVFLDPIGGTVVGAGATTNDLIADWRDDSVSTGQMIGNAVMGYGMDALGLIPIFGNVISRTGKVVKGAIKMAPRLAMAWGTYEAAKNFPEITNSIKKLTSWDGKEENKMTVQDWRNIAQAITIVTSGVRGYRNRNAVQKARQNALVNDEIGLRLSDGKNYKFNGETAKQLREAANNNDIGKMNEILKGLEFNKDGKLTVSTYNTWGPKWRGFHGEPAAEGQKGAWQFPAAREARAATFDIYKSNIGLAGNSRLTLWYNKKMQLQNVVPVGRSGNKKGAKTVAEVDEMVNKQVNDLVEKLKYSNAVREENIKTVKERLLAKEPELNTAKQTAQQKKDVYDKARSDLKAAQTAQASGHISGTTKYTDADLRADLSAIRSKLPELRKWLAKLKTFGQKQIPRKKADLIKHEQKKKQIESEIDKIKNQMKAYGARARGYNNWKKQVSEIPDLQTKVKKARTDFNNANKSANIAQKLIDMLNNYLRRAPLSKTKSRRDFEARNPVGNMVDIGGRQVDLGQMVQDLLRQNNIKYKVGGKINRSLLSKHLASFKI